MNTYYKDDLVELIHGECMKTMLNFANNGVKFDAIITDPPYGTTACKWDVVIPFNDMWNSINQIKHKTTPVVLFGSEPFSSNLRVSNIKEYKYDWIWNKNRFVNQCAARKQALKIHEIISVFYAKQCMYNPQGIIRINKRTRQGTRGSDIIGNQKRVREYVQEYTNYPRSIIEFKSDMGLHPTQKPIALLEYLIKTYTNEGDLILDFTCGSSSTLVAAQNTNRRCIGIELDEDYCKVSKVRLENNMQRILEHKTVV